MSILDSILNIFFQFKFVILFYTAVVLLVYLNRKRLTKEGPFMYLYKTKLGLGLMDKAGKRLRWIIKAFGYFSIFLGYIGFVFVTYLLVKSSHDLIVSKPGAVGGSPVIPGLPIAGLGITFPLVIGWITFFIIMIVHEFSHGVVAKAHNLKVKSSGLAFFGPIFGAFVEPDEKEIVKQSYLVQNSVYSAGPISNIVLFLVINILMIGIIPFGATIYYTSMQVSGANVTVNPAFLEGKGPLYFSLDSAIIDNSIDSGIKFDTIKNDSYPAFKAGIPDGSVITSVDNVKVANFTDFLSAMGKVMPNDTVAITTKAGQNYNLKAINNPTNESLGFIGVTNFEQDRMPKDSSLFSDYFLKFLLWLFQLFWWVQFISINIGLINLFPIFITDGARILKTNVDLIFKDKKQADSVFGAINFMGLFIIGTLVFLPFIRWAISFL